MGFRMNYYFYFQLNTDPLLVLIEYVPYGDLLGYLRKSRGLNDTYFKDPDVKPQTNLTAEQLMRFAWQVADGMFYLSSRKVCVSRREGSIHILGLLRHFLWVRLRILKTGLIITSNWINQSKKHSVWDIT